MSREKLTFAMGCFWGPQDRFSRIPGVTRTEVGYSGGEAESPTHRQLNGHSEVVEIEFDPDQVTLEELLERFWSSHNPSTIEGYKPEDSRYRSLLFYRNEQQRAVMERVQRKMTEQGLSSQATDLQAVQPFYPAEEKHQYYEEKQRKKKFGFGRL
ncbi:peptide-methionine (S)-S-oxide reductase MsrA [Saccharibacillus sacchari]|uniref:Peptide-methionine (S)-S-oxide reductase MsrA n=1 Tax=Saccharibacillus sacchari TaxID=456493 RepID=A0ACC6PG54_9BACL